MKQLNVHAVLYAVALGARDLVYIILLFNIQSGCLNFDFSVKLSLDFEVSCCGVLLHLLFCNHKLVKLVTNLVRKLWNDLKDHAALVRNQR